MQWLCFFPALVLAQKPYFQQEVRYFIQVALDPSKHLLQGDIRIEYTNRSPDTLRGLYMHLWPNAYSRRGTAYDRQKRISGNSRFYFAKAEERGFMDSLEFRVGGVPVRPQPATVGPKPAPGYSLTLLRHAPDVVWLPLPEPLSPGRTVTLETPFRVQIPRTFSRMGRSGGSYQITQWHPKPAVYDAQGWHPLPYLDQGEFYSERGRYEVEITVPKNFLVAATGVLQTASEQTWLQQRAAETADWIAHAQATSAKPTPSEIPAFTPKRLSPQDSLPPLPEWAANPKPSPTYKTLRFVQDSVHDFAWFTAPDYGLLADTLTLPNGHRIACVGVFRLRYFSAWQHTPRYIAEALQKLSNWVGPYPYAHATAVEGGLEAGGGMEYPMITVIQPVTDTSTLRTVVVHEIGHNWFQGIIASNERLHPWQDEGVNSYYEQRILSQPLESPTDTTGRQPSVRVSIAGLSVSLGKKGQGIAARLGNPLLAAYHHLNTDQPFTLSSEQYSLLNYGLGIYQRTALMLSTFEARVGQAAWDKAMQHYWQQWAFRHPTPESWAQSLTETGLPGEALLQALYSDAEPDYHLKALRLGAYTYQIRLTQRCRGYPKALPLSAIALSKKGEVLARYTLSADTTFTVTLPAGTHFFAVNPDQVPFERRVGNNFFYARRPFRTWQRLRIGVLPLTLPVMGCTYLSLAPVFGYNYRDGLMAGLLFTHGLFPKRLLEFHALPMYSFLAKDLRGSAGLTLRAFPTGSRLQLVEGRLRSAQFAGFWRTKASVDLTFRRPYDQFGFRHVVRLRSHLLAYGSLLGESPLRWENAGRPAYTALDWEARREEAILQLYGFASVGHDLAEHFRAEAEAQLYWRAARRWTPFLRAYAGWVANGAPNYLLLRPSGFDPFGEQVLLDRFREGPSRLLRQQMPETQGAWRTPTDTLTTNTLLAANVELPFPHISFLTLRADVGYLPAQARSYWGLSLGLPVIRLRGRCIAGGYFPLAGPTFPQNRPTSLADIVHNFTWSLQVPLDLRWTVPW